MSIFSNKCGNSKCVDIVISAAKSAKASADAAEKSAQNAADETIAALENEITNVVKTEVEAALKNSGVVTAEAMSQNTYDTLANKAYPKLYIINTNI